MFLAFGAEGPVDHRKVRVGTAGRCPPLPQLGACRVPAWLSYFPVRGTARKGEASPRASHLGSGGQRNCFCLFRSHFALPQPDLRQGRVPRARLGAASSVWDEYRVELGSALQGGFVLGQPCSLSSQIKNKQTNKKSNKKTPDNKNSKERKKGANSC